MKYSFKTRHANVIVDKKSGKIEAISYDTPRSEMLMLIPVVAGRRDVNEFDVIKVKITKA